jgi:hypothetical protein
MTSEPRLSIFDTIGCWLSIALVLVLTVAIVYFRPYSDPIPSPSNDQAVSSMSAILITSCWVLLLLVGVWVAAAAFIYVLRPEQFWAKCHAVNLGLVALAFVWIGIEPSDLLGITLALICGAVGGYTLVWVKAYLWKGGQVGLIVLGIAITLLPVAGRNYVLPVIGSLSIAMALHLFFARSRS